MLPLPVKASLAKSLGEYKKPCVLVIFARCLHELESRISERQAGGMRRSPVAWWAGVEMKVMFWITVEPHSYLPHAIAIALKERYGVSDFSAIVRGRQDVYKVLKGYDVKYDSIVVLQDIFLKSQEMEVDHDYLASLEEKYGIPNLWMYPLADRDFLNFNYYFFTHEDLMKAVQGYFKYITELLEKVRPDFIIMPLAENMTLLVVHEVAQRMKIPTLVLTPARVGDRVAIVRSIFEEWDKIFKTYEKLQSGEHKSHYREEALKYIREFREKGGTYSSFVSQYTARQEFFESIFRAPIKILTRTLRYSYHYYFGNFKNDFMYKNKSPPKLAMEELSTIARWFALKRSKFFVKPDYKEQYVYFPLHREPEVATMLFAPFYIGQVALIENIAKSLPMHFKLYVKEHPIMFGFQPISFYKRLLRVPNIRLIHPSTPSCEVVKNARLVITIAGTPGWEALLYKKPVITFGRTFYNKMDMVVKAKDVTSLPELVRDTLKNYKHDEGQLINFISAIFEGSFSASFDIGEESVEKTLAHPDFNKYVDALAQEMGLKAPASQKGEGSPRRDKPSS